MALHQISFGYERVWEKSLPEAIRLLVIDKPYLPLKLKIMDFEKALKRKQALIPKSGYNLVGLDTFAEPDDDGALFLIGHFENEEEAIIEADKYRKPATKVFVYGPDDC